MMITNKERKGLCRGYVVMYLIDEGRGGEFSIVYGYGVPLWDRLCI